MFSVSNLSCSRGDKRLFSGVSFALQPGKWLHLEGDNGVGKTSLLRLACGLSALEQGEIQWQGQPVSQNSDEFRANLAYLGHQLALKEDLTPLENLRADAAIAGRALSGRCQISLGAVGPQGARAFASSCFVSRAKTPHSLGPIVGQLGQVVDFGRAFCGIGQRSPKRAVRGDQFALV